MKNNKINIIDIRNRNQYQEGHIPSAINIPYENLIYQPEKFLDKNNVYYIYCQYGINSSYVKSKLIQQGYHIINIDGGYSTYKKYSNL